MFRDHPANQDIDIDLLGMQPDSQVKELFDFLKNENNCVDIVHLKTQLHANNIHNTNTSLFKKINDLALDN